MKLSRFHIRDLFWLVLVVALGLGWWVERSQNHPAHPPDWKPAGPGVGSVPARLN